MKDQRQGLTRRQLAFSAAAASPLLAAQAPATAPADELEAARAQAKLFSAQIRKVKVPQLLEPVFAFRP